MASPNEITPVQLNRLIGTPAAPVLIDMRIDEDFDDDPRLIPGAVRHAHTELGPLTEGAGVHAEVLEGGQFAWRDANLPMLRAAALPAPDAQGCTVWVTRHRPKIDRIACPWLVRRFIDPHAQFLFVPPQDVALVAEKFSATPFDVENVPFSHRGEACSFDTFLSEFELSIPALDTMATIVRGADTDRHDLAPEAAGLLAFSLGLSRMYRDDLEQLEAGMTFYDALYRWARDAQDEGHDWPAKGAS